MKGKCNSVDRASDRFSKLDFHDDRLISVSIRPGRRRAAGGSIELQFEDDSTGTAKSLCFRSCANVRFVMDFDVLASNWFAQTHDLACRTDAKQLEAFVRGQSPHWRTKYMPPLSPDAPIKKKLSSIGSYRLFRITFFGGTLEVIAKSFVTSGEAAQFIRL